MAEEGDQRGGVFIWWSADGRRWKVHKQPEGYRHCRIGETGKRLGEWEPGLPPGLEGMPKNF